VGKELERKKVKGVRNNGIGEQPVQALHWRKAIPHHLPECEEP
jgi:hypothetical protein